MKKAFSVVLSVVMLLTLSSYVFAVNDDTFDNSIVNEDV